MKQTRMFLAAVAVAALAIPAVAGEGHGKAFEWSTKSAEARNLLSELQQRVESFQGGPRNAELAQQIVAADPQFAMGHYYVAATSAGPDGAAAFARAVELAAGASDGERRFIEGMQPAFANQGANFKDAIPPLEALSKDYPGERLVWMILGQLYNGNAQADQARAAFERARQLGSSPRVESFLAGYDLLEGHYAKARITYQAIEKKLPEGSAPFAIRFGTTFSYLYEGNVDAALESLQTYLKEYRATGANQAFPEVFIWNAIARINLENGRLEQAMKAYENGYDSVPGSNLPEDQKQTWLGRLHHGKARTLAKMGQHAEAWKQVEEVKTMIEGGGEAAEQFWPAYHYLAGYVLLEANKNEQALEHLKQANPQDPFHTLLLARAHERLGHKAEAKKAYQSIVDSSWPGVERALAFPEAKHKTESL